MRRHWAALGLALALGGCSSSETSVPGCATGIPPASQLLADPAFAALRFHKKDEFDIRRGFGYDLWADSKFEYRTALEYSLVPTAHARSDDDLCAFAIALRFGMPANDEDKRRLSVLARAVGAASSADAAGLESRLLAVLQSGDKFRPRGLWADTAVEAGALTHPARGDFFMVKLAWTKPPAPSK
jgi:hypothetical protein